MDVPVPMILEVAVDADEDVPRRGFLTRFENRS